MNKNISILGCGWLGKPLVIKLIEEGFTVKGSTTTTRKFDEFKNLSLEEESLFCSFTYEKKPNKALKLEIHDIWSEGETEISFLCLLG